MQLFLSSLEMEIVHRSEELTGIQVDTIYFGGGTPSLLFPKQAVKIIDLLKEHVAITSDLEISLEANPDDLNEQKMEQWVSIGINRMSIGVQSFSDRHLRFMQRRHTAEDTHHIIEAALQSSALEVSLDLIYGLPELSMEEWKQTLNQAISYPVSHISAYHLTFEKGTSLHDLLLSGGIAETDEENSWNQFEVLMQILESGGFEHYEISNFARNGKYSRHNLKYWTGLPYVGLGPSAHSFNGSVRKWNPSDLESYIRVWRENGLRAADPFMIEESIDATTARNEFIMTRLRTRWGIHLNEWRDLAGELAARKLLERAQVFIRNGDMILSEDKLKLTKQGMFRSDGIMVRLFEKPEGGS